MLKELGITTENYPIFKSSYEKASVLNQSYFYFFGKQILTGYAKYVVEYWEDTRIKK